MPIIRHLVLLEFKKETLPEDVTSIENQLKACTQQIPGAAFSCFCEYIGLTDNKNFTHYFFIDFEDAGARDKYLEDPEHQRIASKEIMPKLFDGVNSVIVFDYEKSPKPFRQYKKNSTDLLSTYTFFYEQKNEQTINTIFKEIDSNNVIKNTWKSNCTVETLDQGFIGARIVKFMSPVSTDGIVDNPTSFTFYKTHNPA